MRNTNATETVRKDVVIIGNGPSGLAMSYMLSGNIPFLVSKTHPDELLSARLSSASSDDSLVYEDLGYLATGIEGRATNPISLLLDSLSHPYADMGFELDPLIEWRKEGTEVDHVVLGKGPPGGSWHKMDPHILTLSLGSWMALPGLPYKVREGLEKRASAGNVAQYYVQYVKDMNLEKNFRSGVCVLNVKQIKNSCEERRAPCDGSLGPKTRWVEKVDNGERVKLCAAPEVEPKRKICALSNALNFMKLKNRKCKRPRDLKADSESCCSVKGSKKNKTGELSPIVHSNLIDICRPPSLCKGKTRSISLSYDPNSVVYSSSLSESFEQGSFLKNSRSVDLIADNEVPNLNCDRLSEHCDQSSSMWMVETYDMVAGKYVTYVCKYLVLANGASDLPNRLAVPGEKKDPTWLVHDVRSLEMELDLYLAENTTSPDPVLVIGAGLSAADAIIATRCRNVPVLHVFRNKNSDLGKQLPENMYPEYHKVHQMMQDGGSTYPLYRALPECTPVAFDEAKRTVTLLTKSGEELNFSVSFAAVLIGARPNLSFLPSHAIGIRRDQPVDSKTNIVDIDKLNHTVHGYEGLYAMGPLAGDNFVRFIPGGALAIVSNLYKKYGC